MTIENISTIAILVQLDNGNAHQVLATAENKKAILHLLAQMEGALRLTKEIEPIQFIEKP